MMKISKLSIDEIQESEFQIYKCIQFISEEQIKLSAWLKAEDLVANIDPNDIQYIAYSKHSKCKISSGDKALMNGLKKKEFTNFFYADEMYKLYITKNSRKK